jgi:hypothetical protein
MITDLCNDSVYDFDAIEFSNEVTQISVSMHLRSDIRSNFVACLSWNVSLP